MLSNAYGRKRLTGRIGDGAYMEQNVSKNNTRLEKMDNRQKDPVKSRTSGLNFRSTHINPDYAIKKVIPFGILVKEASRGSEYFSQEKYLIRRLKTPLTRIIFTYPSADTFYCVIRV